MEERGKKKGIRREEDRLGGKVGTKGKFNFVHSNAGRGVKGLRGKKRGKKG